LRPATTAHPRDSEFDNDDFQHLKLFRCSNRKILVFARLTLLQLHLIKVAFEANASVSIGGGRTAKAPAVATGEGKTMLDMTAPEAAMLPPPEASGEDLFRLGLSYATGNGAPLDYVVAHKWFNLAALRGFQEAKEHRRELSDQMSSFEIAAAQRAAREWLYGAAPAAAAH
jgi:hypothetical protein